MAVSIMIRRTKMESDRKREHNSKRGSITLEAAISISLLLLVIVFMLSAIMTCQIETAVGNALDNTAAEISLIIPFADMAIDSSEPLQSVIADLENFDQQLSGNPFFSLLYDGQITDLLSSVLFGKLISQRCDYWLQDAASGQKLNLNLINENTYIEMIWHEENNFLMLQAKFEIRTIFGTMDREVRSVVPLWTGRSRDVADEETSGPNVWQLDNFSRGIALRDHFGADLPLGFPVIALFDNGIATAIRSMDLTAPTYQDDNRVIKSVASEIDRLADFDGFKGSAKMPEINNDMITQRKLMLIIPNNSPESFERELLPELRILADSRLIRLEVIRYLDSCRNEA